MGHPVYNITKLFYMNAAIFSCFSCGHVSTTTISSPPAFVKSDNEINDTDNVPLIAGICSGVVAVIIMTAVGIFLHRRKIRDVEWRTRVEMANMERRMPGEHHEYTQEGEYYGDDKTTYYTVYVRTQSADSE